MVDADPFAFNFTPAEMYFDFFDAGMSLISTHTGATKTSSTGVFVQQSEVATIPANTRTIRCRLFTNASWGGDLIQDDFSITTSLYAADTSFADDDFNYGVLTFDSGLNAGLSMDVKDYDHDSKTFTLYLPMAYPIAVGDKMGVHIGCDKEPSRCLALGNKINFGGFEFIPGDDAFLRTPDSPY